MVLQEGGPDTGLVRPLRNAHRIQLPQAMSFLGGQLQAHLVETVLQAFMIGPVACPAVLETLLKHEAKGLVQGVVHGNRCGVVVDPGAIPPVVGQQVNVEVPAPDGVLASLDGLHGPVAQGHGRETRRTTEALLRTTVDGIDFPFVDAYGAPAEGGHDVE